MKAVPAFFVFAGLVCALGAPESRAALQQSTNPQLQQPTFRGGITVVPLNVTVLDKNRKPITDLTAADFTIYEDNVKQKLSVFTTQALKPEPVDPNAPIVRGTNPETADRLTPQHHRVFLIMLAYSHLQEPTKAIDATLTFLRQHLLPQDVVAVMIFDRVTDLTTDHDYVAGVVENYRKQSEKLMSDIDDFTCHAHGPAGPLSVACRIPPVPATEPPDLPESIQKRIDALFAVSPNGAARTPRMRDVRDLLFGTRRFDAVNAENPGSVSWNLLITRADGMKEAAAIEYLRYLDAEKHLIALVPDGLGLGSVDSDKRFAARANAARIVVDLIHTGGVPMGIERGGPSAAPTGRGTRRSDAPPMARGSACMGYRCDMIPASPPITAAHFFWGAASSERVAELTGGQFLGSVYADKAFAAIDETNRFEYLLGYVPSKPIIDGTYRQIVVKVNRPGATVIFRHGYQPQETLSPVDVGELLASARTTGEAETARSSTDIGVTARVVSPPHGVSGDTLVTLHIEAQRLVLTHTSEGRWTGSLLVQVFCGDAKETVVCSLKDRITLDWSDEGHAKAKADGIAYSTRIPTGATIKYVKAVVYDFGSDLLGSATVTIGG